MSEEMATKNAKRHQDGYKPTSLRNQDRSFYSSRNSLRGEKDSECSRMSDKQARTMLILSRIAPLRGDETSPQECRRKRGRMSEEMATKNAKRHQEGYKLT